GETDIDVGPEGDPEGFPTDGGGDEDATARASLNWTWPCDGSDDAGVSGEGDHELVGAGSGFDVTVTGEICEPDVRPRDIIFVVDVSDSMRGLFNLGNDPLVSGSCGRLDAVRAVAGQVGENARISFVTFDGDLEESLND